MVSIPDRYEQIYGDVSTLFADRFKQAPSVAHYMRVCDDAQAEIDKRFAMEFPGLIACRLLETNEIAPPGDPAPANMRTETNAEFRERVLGGFECVDACMSDQTAPAPRDTAPGCS